MSGMSATSVADGTTPPCHELPAVQNPVDTAEFHVRVMRGVTGGLAAECSDSPPNCDSAVTVNWYVTPLVSPAKEASDVAGGDPLTVWNAVPGCAYTTYCCSGPPPLGGALHVIGPTAPFVASVT